MIKVSRHPLRVVITGGASSVGLACAQEFATRGDSVFVTDISASALKDLRDAYPAVSAELIDVTDPGAVEAYFRLVSAKVDGVDVLVNTVGIPGPRCAIEKVSYEDWNSTLWGSVGAAFACAKQVIPFMKQQRFGSIVNFSSSSTKTCLPMRTPYVAAKFAVEGLTLNLARELGPFNIRVNAILPGAIDNSRLEHIVVQRAAERGVSPDEYERDLLRFISMRSKVSVTEIAQAVLFLADSRVPHVTGQLLAIDGNVEWEE